MKLKEIGATPIPSLILMGLFFWVSHMPGDDIHLPHFPGIDKIFHTLAYSVLGATLSVWGLQRKPKPSPWMVCLSIGILFGISDEIHQSYVPGRFAGWQDALADAIGVALGSGVFYLKPLRKIFVEKTIT